jgi:hypothetical protein
MLFLASQPASQPASRKCAAPRSTRSQCRDCDLEQLLTRLQVERGQSGACHPSSSSSGGGGGRYGRSQRTAALSAADQARVLLHVCAALRRLAAARVAHADVKPANILVSMAVTVRWRAGAISAHRGGPQRVGALMLCVCVCVQTWAVCLFFSFWPGVLACALRSSC